MCVIGSLTANQEILTSFVRTSEERRKPFLGSGEIALSAKGCCNEQGNDLGALGWVCQCLKSALLVFLLYVGEKTCF